MGRTENSTERLQASRGHRHWAKEIRPSQTLFGVSGEVRSKNNLTESALLEMSGNATTQASGLRKSRFRTRGLLTVISGLLVRELRWVMALIRLPVSFPLLGPIWNWVQAPSICDKPDELQRCC
jgi:hypothetical protein